MSLLPVAHSHPQRQMKRRGWNWGVVVACSFHSCVAFVSVRIPTCMCINTSIHTTCIHTLRYTHTSSFFSSITFTPNSIISWCWPNSCSIYFFLFSLYVNYFCWLEMHVLRLIYTFCLADSINSFSLATVGALLPFAYLQDTQLRIQFVQQQQQALVKSLAPQKLDKLWLVLSFAALVPFSLPLHICFGFFVFVPWTNTSKVVKESSTVLYNFTSQAFPSIYTCSWSTSTAESI